jgi:hypothetical protein
MLQSILNTLFGCSHSRTTFPLTPGRNTTAPGATRSGTYVVCLDCGKEFAYDWAGMRVGNQVVRRPGVILPSTAETLAPVAEGRFEGLRRHVS